jgi:hypothetical protein
LTTGVKRYLLKHSITIRQLSAAFFLLLFSFCITPKRFLHDMLANHKDAPSSAAHAVEQVATSGFHCHIDDLVVVAPFLPEIQSAVVYVKTSSPVRFSEPVSAFNFFFLSHADGRAPPVSVCS